MPSFFVKWTGSRNISFDGIHGRHTRYADDRKAGVFRARKPKNDFGACLKWNNMEWNNREFSR